MKSIKRIYIFILVTLCFNFQILDGQIVPTCSVYNKEIEKMSLNSLSNLKLRKMLETFFILGDTDYTERYFLPAYKPKIINDSLVLLNIKDGSFKYEIKAQSRRFKPSEHQILMSQSKTICLIDNKVYWGTMGDFPTEQLVNFTVKINNKNISIPESDFKDLFNPSLHCGKDCVSLNAKKDKKGEYFLILLRGSDGGASYLAIWIFKDGKYLKRVVASSE